MSASSDDPGRLFRLEGRVAVITGGAGLLGRMHAEAVASAGGVPVIADVRASAAEEAAAALRAAFGVRATAVGVDITRKDEVERLRDAVLAEHGRIDALVNNAAVDPKVGGDDAAFGRFETFSVETWERELAVGLTGAFLCAQALGTEMASRGGGVILNISSDLGIVAPDQRIYQRPDAPPDRQPVKPVTYSVIKTGLLGLTRYLATYWATQGVRVNALCPAGVEAGQDDDFKRRLCGLVPMGRMARRDEYKGAVLFLLSDASSYMTGATLVVDGGRTCW